MNKKIIRLVVFSQLENAIYEIFNELNDEYIFYKEEDECASPKKFINEIVEIGLMQESLKKQIDDIQKYYVCNMETAVLLYKFTDAYKLMTLY